MELLGKKCSDLLSDSTPAADADGDASEESALAQGKRPAVTLLEDSNGEVFQCALPVD